MRRNFSREWLETASKLSQEKHQRQCLSCRTKRVLSYQAPSTIQKCEVEARLFSRFGSLADEHLAKPRFKFPLVYGPLSSQCVRANDTLALPSRRKYDGHRKETEKHTSTLPSKFSSQADSNSFAPRKWVDVTGTQQI